MLILASNPGDVVTHHVAPGVTWLFASILVAMIACLALEEKLHAKKSLIVGLFATVCLLLAEVFELVHRQEVLILGHPIELPVYVPGIDWAVIAIILGSSLFVDVTSQSGLFSWIATRLTKASGGDPRKLLWFYGLMTVAFSAVLNNVTAMIIVGSLSGVSLRKLNRADLLLGFLLIEGLLTNVGGLLTLISSVPDIIVGTTAGISFVAFFVKSAPFVAVSTVLTMWMGARLFRVPGLTGPIERAEAARLVAGFDENDGVESKRFFWFGAAMLVLFIVTIATTSVLPWVSDLGMGYVALAFGAIMLLRYKHEVDRFYRAIDWDLLGFFAALFAVIYIMEHAQVLSMIGAWVKPLIGLGDAGGAASILVASAVASTVTDNIPLAAMLAKILAPIEGVGGNPDSPFWWAVVFGSNLGGNLTPIGSASTLVAVTLMHKYGVKLTFAGFVAKAIPFAAMQIVLAMAYVVFVLGMMS